MSWMKNCIALKSPDVDFSSLCGTVHTDPEGRKRQKLCTCETKCFGGTWRAFNTFDNHKQYRDHDKSPITLEFKAALTRLQVEMGKLEASRARRKSNDLGSRTAVSTTNFHDNKRPCPEHRPGAPSLKQEVVDARLDNAQPLKIPAVAAQQSLDPERRPCATSGQQPPHAPGVHGQSPSSRPADDFAPGASQRATSSSAICQSAEERQDPNAADFRFKRMAQYIITTIEDMTYDDGRRLYFKPDAELLPRIRYAPQGIRDALRDRTFFFALLHYEAIAPHQRFTYQRVRAIEQRCLPVTAETFPSLSRIEHYIVEITRFFDPPHLA